METESKSNFTKMRTLLTKNFHNFKQFEEETWNAKQSSEFVEMTNKSLDLLNICIGEVSNSLVSKQMKDLSKVVNSVFETLVFQLKVALRNLNSSPQRHKNIHVQNDKVASIEKLNSRTSNISLSIKDRIDSAEQSTEEQKVKRSNKKDSCLCRCHTIVEEFLKKVTENQLNPIKFEESKLKITKPSDTQKVHMPFYAEDHYIERESQKLFIKFEEGELQDIQTVANPFVLMHLNQRILNSMLNSQNQAQRDIDSLLFNIEGLDLQNSQFSNLEHKLKMILSQNNDLLRESLPIFINELIPVLNLENFELGMKAKFKDSLQQLWHVFVKAMKEVKKLTSCESGTMTLTSAKILDETENEYQLQMKLKNEEIDQKSNDIATMDLENRRLVDELWHLKKKNSDLENYLEFEKSKYAEALKKNDGLFYSYESETKHAENLSNVFKTVLKLFMKYQDEFLEFRNILVQNFRFFKEQIEKGNKIPKNIIAVLKSSKNTLLFNFKLFEIFSKQNFLEKQLQVSFENLIKESDFDFQDELFLKKETFDGKNPEKDAQFQSKDTLRQYKNIKTKQNDKSENINDSGFEETFTNQYSPEMEEFDPKIDKRDSITRKNKDSSKINSVKRRSQTLKNDHRQMSNGVEEYVNDSNQSESIQLNNNNNNLVDKTTSGKKNQKDKNDLQQNPDSKQTGFSGNPEMTNSNDPKHNQFNKTNKNAQTKVQKPVLSEKTTKLVKNNSGQNSVGNFENEIASSKNAQKGENIIFESENENENIYEHPQISRQETNNLHQNKNVESVIRSKTAKQLQKNRIIEKKETREITGEENDDNKFDSDLNYQQNINSQNSVNNLPDKKRVEKKNKLDIKTQLKNNPGLLTSNANESENWQTDTNEIIPDMSENFSSDIENEKVVTKSKKHINKNDSNLIHQNSRKEHYRKNSESEIEVNSDESQPDFKKQTKNNARFKPQKEQKGEQYRDIDNGIGESNLPDFDREIQQNHENMHNLSSSDFDKKRKLYQESKTAFQTESNENVGRKLNQKSDSSSYVKFPSLNRPKKNECKFFERNKESSECVIDATNNKTSSLIKRKLRFHHFQIYNIATKNNQKQIFEFQGNEIIPTSNQGLACFSPKNNDIFTKLINLINSLDEQNQNRLKSFLESKFYQNGKTMKFNIIGSVDKHQHLRLFENKPHNKSLQTISSKNLDVLEAKTIDQNVGLHKSQNAIKLFPPSKVKFEQEDFQVRTVENQNNQKASNLKTNFNMNIFGKDKLKSQLEKCTRIKGSIDFSFPIKRKAPFVPEIDKLSSCLKNDRLVTNESPVKKLSQINEIQEDEKNKSEKLPLNENQLRLKNLEQSELKTKIEKVTNPIIKKILQIIFANKIKTTDENAISTGKEINKENKTEEPFEVEPKSDIFEEIKKKLILGIKNRLNEIYALNRLSFNWNFVCEKSEKYLGMFLKQHVHCGGSCAHVHDFCIYLKMYLSKVVSVAPWAPPVLPLDTIIISKIGGKK